MKNYINNVVEKLTIHRLNLENLKLSSIKGDLNVLVEVLLKGSSKPLFYIISQRSQTIIKLKEDFVKEGKIVVDNKTLLREAKKIQHFIDI